MKWPFVSRHYHEDAMLDAERKINQLDRAARTYLFERDKARSELAALKDREQGA